MDAAQLQAYITWLNSGNPPNSLGDAFLGGPTRPANPLSGLINVTAQPFGAKADSNPATDDSVPIQAAIDFARTVAAGSTIPVFIPPAPVQAGGQPGYYNLKHSLKVYENTCLFSVDGGQNLTRLHFVDCKGIEPFDPTHLTPDVTLANLWFEGNGPSSTSVTATIGIHMNAGNRWIMNNIQCNDFVDQCTFDTNGVGCGGANINNFYSISAGTPNATNGYPRYGFHLLATGGGQPQSIDVRNFYMSGTVTSTGFPNGTGNGVLTTFGDFTLNQLLFREAGFKVYYVNSGGHALRQSSDPGTGTYKLYNMDSGSAVLIPHNATYVGAAKVRVVFNAPVANGQTIEFIQNDPTMQVAIQAAVCNICSFHGQGVQGAIIGVFDGSDGRNSYFFDNMEIHDIAWQLAGPRSLCISLSYNATVDQIYMPSGGTSNFITSQYGSGWEWTEGKGTVTVGNQNITSTTAYTNIAYDGTGSGLLGYSEYDFCSREVQVEFTAAMTVTGGGVGTTHFVLEATYDNGNSFVNLGDFFISGYNTAGNENFFVTVSQTFKDLNETTGIPNAAYLIPNNFYRLKAINITDLTQCQIQCNSNLSYRIRVRDTNRIAP